MFSAYHQRTSQTFTSKRLLPEQQTARTVADTQVKIPGWNQKNIAQATTVQIGAGGTGGQLAYYQTKIGIGTVHITDPDPVELSNLNRQLFLEEDLHEPKGPAIAKRVAQHGFLGTMIHGHSYYLSEFLEHQPDVMPDVILVCVDNNKTRREAQAWSLQIQRPLIDMGIARDASSGYVFVHVPGQACLACYMGPALLDTTKSPCPGTPAALDVLQTVCGHAAYALSTLLTKRQRFWSLTRAYLPTGTTVPANIERKADCELCSNTAL